jgi:hypothetical protein
VAFNALGKGFLTGKIDKNPVLPIPGTTKLHDLEKSIGAAAVELTSEELRQIAPDGVPTGEDSTDTASEDETQRLRPTRSPHGTRRREEPTPRVVRIAPL